jgi:hypothetical protein
LGFFDRVEVCALEVLDECNGEEVFVGQLSDEGGDVVPAQLGGSAKATFSGSQFVAISGRRFSDGDWLKEACSSQAVLEFFELFRFEIASRLEGVWANGGDWDPVGGITWRRGVAFL